jgi:hypothetical protein
MGAYPRCEEVVIRKKEIIVHIIHSITHLLTDS